jgi:hypothetical protein
MTKSKWRRFIRIERGRCVDLAFGAGCLFVAAVSVHDAVLVILHHNVIGHVEQNPIGKWLIAAQQGDVWLFIFLKLCGTAVVCAILVTLYRWRRRLAWAAMVGLIGFQFFLLLYLIVA